MEASPVPTPPAAGPSPLVASMAPRSPAKGRGPAARLRQVAPGLASLGLAITVAACTRESASAQGRDIAALYGVMLVVVAAIFLFVEGTIIWSILRYRRRPDDPSLPPQTHGHRGLEIVWTVIPILIVLGVYALSLETLGKVEAKAADALPVDVHGYQWYWEFDLPQQGVHVSGIGTEPELVLPVNQPIRFRLETDNVIHSFFVPAFLFKRDLIPGSVNEFDLTIDDPGTYAGQCAEFCGAGHADMRFRIRAVSSAEFQAWVESQRASASPSSPAGPAPSAAPSGSPSPGAGPTINLVARNVSFATTSLTAPANTPFTIAFDNEDPSVPHNVQIKDAGGSSVFRGEIVTGPVQIAYQIPALAPGTYTFVCDVHPTTMTGTLTVK
jgi:cytochrome c oxidase subunit II